MAIVRMWVLHCNCQQQITAGLVKVETFVFQSSIVTWKMKAPEKKPLVRKESLEDLRSKVRKGSQKVKIEPVKALSEFQS